MLDGLAAGSACNVTCIDTYVAAAGSVSEYSCSPDGQLSSASLTCDPPNCALPASLGANVVAGTCTPYMAGGLPADTSCDLACASPYVSAGGSTTYTCSSVGQLSSSASLTCKAPVCLLPGSLGANVVAGGCSSYQAPNGLPASTSCDVACAATYVSSGGSATYTCSSVGQLSTSASLTCQPAYVSDGLFDSWGYGLLTAFNCFYLHSL